MLPFLSLAFFWRFFGKLDNDNVSSSLGSFYDDLKLNSKTAVLYNAIFLFRRLTLPLVLVFLAAYPYLQVMFMIFQNLLVLIYLFEVRPFETPFMNRLEIFNEACVLVSTYMILLFSDFVGDIYI